MQNVTFGGSSATITSNKQKDPLGLLQITRLSPNEVAESIARRLSYLDKAYAPNTKVAWRTAWVTWQSFCNLQRWALLPTTVERVEQFLEAQIAAGKKRATLELYLYTLNVVHQVVGLDNPMNTIEGRLMWRAFRHHRLTAVQRQAHPLRLDEIERIVGLLDLSVERDLRDATLLRVSYDLMSRRSEVIQLQVEHLNLKKNVALLARSKTDQESKGRIQWLSPESCELLKQYLQRIGLTEGAVFRSIRRTRRDDGHGRPLSVRDVNRIYKRLGDLAGIDTDRISGHSTRVGAAQDLYAAQMPTVQIMQSGRWKSERMVLAYTRELAANESGMAQFQRKRTGRGKKMDIVSEPPECS